MENNKQQTAVEWLFLMLNNPETHDAVILNERYFSESKLLKYLQEAKQMEKKKLEECWITAHQAGRFEGKGIAIQNWQTFEQYYNESQEQ